MQARKYWQRLTEAEQAKRLHARNERARKYPGITKAEAQSIGSRDKPKRGGEAYHRICVICNGSKTKMSHRTSRFRMDGQPFMLSPQWYRSKLVENRYECAYCYDKAYYIKNKEWIQSRQKRWRLQRRKLMTKMLKSLSKIDNSKKKAKN